MKGLKRKSHPQWAQDNVGMLGRRLIDAGVVLGGTAGKRYPEAVRDYIAGRMLPLDMDPNEFAMRAMQMLDQADAWDRLNERADHERDGRRQ